jgi:hypothetical protein
MFETDSRIHFLFNFFSGVPADVTQPRNPTCGSPSFLGRPKRFKRRSILKRFD